MDKRESERVREREKERERDRESEKERGRERHRQIIEHKYYNDLFTFTVTMNSYYFFFISKPVN